MDIASPFADYKTSLFFSARDLPQTSYITDEKIQDRFLFAEEFLRIIVNHVSIAATFIPCFFFPFLVRYIITL